MKPLSLATAFWLLAFTARADEKAANIPDGLVGTWESQDLERHPLVFAKDGTFQYGDEKVDGGWKFRTGTFTIDAAGKITAELKFGSGAVFRPWYKYKDGVLTGPRGPKPTVTWKKVEKK